LAAGGAASFYLVSRIRAVKAELKTELAPVASANGGAQSDWAQFQVGAGFVPGGGAMARLSRLVGRGRALEILLVADDFDGTRSELYGYANRAIADDELDDEVDAIASRRRVWI
jgi:enoyl-CoA hydratase/carnithine racemase